MAGEQEQRVVAFGRLLGRMNEPELQEMAAFMDAAKAHTARRDAIAAIGLGQYVNTVFAAYVAVEAEQYRLGALGTKEADAEANALGDRALALAEELHGIEDYSGSADLVAARALHELMLLNPWNKLGQYEWGEDSRDHLAVVAALAGATTGAVRDEVRRVMTTKGVEIPDEGADPMVALVDEYLHGMAVYNAATGNTDEQDRELQKSTWEPSYDRLGTNPPAPTSLAGVAAAMRVVLFEDDSSGCVGVFVGPVLRAALAFLEGKTAR